MVRELVISSVALLGIIAITAQCGGTPFALAIPDAPTDASTHSAADVDAYDGQHESAGGGDSSGHSYYDSSGGGGDSGGHDSGDRGDAPDLSDSSDAGHGEDSSVADSATDSADSGDAADGDLESGTCSPACGMHRACCGTACCASAQLCCTNGSSMVLQCVTPTAAQPTCP